MNHRITQVGKELKDHEVPVWELGRWSWGEERVRLGECNYDDKGKVRCDEV